MFAVGVCERDQIERLGASGRSIVDAGFFVSHIDQSAAWQGP